MQRYGCVDGVEEGVEECDDHGKGRGHFLLGDEELPEDLLERGGESKGRQERVVGC